MKQLTQLWRAGSPTICPLQGRVSDIVQFKSEGLRTRGTDGLSPRPSVKPQEPGMAG